MFVEIWTSINFFFDKKTNRTDYYTSYKFKNTTFGKIGFNKHSSNKTFVKSIHIKTLLYTNNVSF